MKWVIRGVLALVALLVAAFLVLRVPDTDPEMMQARWGGEPSQFVEIGDGVTVHLRDEGPQSEESDAPAIILLHGSNADLHTWAPWVQGLKETHRVIRFDQVGHGLTGPDPDDDYSRANYASDVIEVANALGLDTFILGGNSMGGKHALSVAHLFPERVAGLILVDASGAPQTQVEKMMDPAELEKDNGGNIGFAIARMPGVNWIAQHITPRSLIEQSLEQSVSNKAIVTPTMVDRYWQMLRYPGNRAATMERFSTRFEPLSVKDIEAITTPALILWGEEDRLIPVEAGQWLDQNLPNSALLVYPGIGHLPQEEAVQSTLRDLKDWLAQRETGAS